jgi:hypothetical protein
MPVDGNLTELAGYPVRDYVPGQGLPEAAEVAWRVRLQPDEASFLDGHLRPFLEEPEAELVRALVIGRWGEGPSEDSSALVVELVEQADRLPALRALFLGDISEDEWEISSIRHGDVTAVAEAFPALEDYGIRGGAGQIIVRPLSSRSLRRLVLESAGIPGAVVRKLGLSSLPNLEHLELWLGSEDSGGDATLVDLQPILAGDTFPRLRRLGLRNSELADEMAAALATAPVTARIAELDLSLGTLGDDGALALLRGQPLSHLTELDLHHHYLTDDGMAHVQASGLRVDLSDRQDEVDGQRYVAVGALR